MTTESMLNPAVISDPSEVNLFDESVFERHDQHRVFKWLRENQPVHYNAAQGEAGMEVKPVWNITKYEDLLFVSRNTQIFSSEKGIVQYAPVNPDDDFAAAAGNGMMLITMDPPRHVKLRRLVNKGFTPRAVALMRPHIQQVATDILNDIAKKGECDFVTEVSALLPLAVICEMMGLEKKDWPLMFNLTNKVLGSGDPEYQTDVPEEQRGTQEASQITGNMGTMQMFGFFAQLLQERRAHRKDDLISILCGSEVDGDELTDQDILWFCFLLILAGNETTRNAISGGLIALCDNPDQRAKLQADMTLLPGAIEEVLRYVSPVTHMARAVLQDTEIRGQKIPAGDRVVMWYPSANRDADIFPNPDKFDITRSPNEHIAFGIGEHFCLGAGFARLELEILFTDVFRRFPDIQINGPIEYLRSTFIGGIKHLPVKFTPEK